MGISWLRILSIFPVVFILWADSTLPVWILKILRVIENVSAPIRTMFVFSSLDIGDFELFSNISCSSCIVIPSDWKRFMIVPFSWTSKTPVLIKDSTNLSWNAWDKSCEIELSTLISQMPIDSLNELDSTFLIVWSCVTINLEPKYQIRKTLIVTISDMIIILLTFDFCLRFFCFLRYKSPSKLFVILLLCFEIFLNSVISSSRLSYLSSGNLLRHLNKTPSSSIGNSFRYTANSVGVSLSMA